MDRDEERRLVDRAQLGDGEALDDLIESQRPLASAIADRYGVSHELIQPALERLRSRVQTFDVGQGHKFSTWAVWWLRHEMGVGPTHDR